MELPLTDEDREIFEMWTDHRTEANYRFADVSGAIKATSALRCFGSVVDCVSTIEKAKRSIERRSAVARDVWNLWVRSYGEAGALRLCASSGLTPRGP